jgi:hypothetical protein
MIAMNRIVVSLVGGRSRRPFVHLYERRISLRTIDDARDLFSPTRKSSQSLITKRNKLTNEA